MENLTNPVSRSVADAEHILERLRRLAAELGEEAERAAAVDLMFLARYAREPDAVRALRVAVGLFERLLEARPPRRRITAGEARAALERHGTLRRAARALGVSPQTIMRCTKIENTCSIGTGKLPPTRESGR